MTLLETLLAQYAANSVSIDAARSSSRAVDALQELLQQRGPAFAAGVGLSPESTSLVARLVDRLPHGAQLVEALDAFPDFDNWSPGNLLRQQESASVALGKRLVELQQQDPSLTEFLVEWGAEAADISRRGLAEGERSDAISDAFERFGRPTLPSIERAGQEGTQASTIEPDTPWPRWGGGKAGGPGGNTGGGQDEVGS